MLPMGENMTDTEKKILVRDHDILISLHTLFQEMTRRFDAYITSNNEMVASLRGEVKAISDNEIRLDGRMKALEERQSDLEKHVIELQSKNMWMDVAGILGAAIAAAIAWFR